MKVSGMLRLLALSVVLFASVHADEDDQVCNK
jgi:hypothetical protein